MLSLGVLFTDQSPSTKKRWPRGWQSHCMAGGTVPLCERDTCRALHRKGRCGGDRHRSALSGGQGPSSVSQEMAPSSQMVLSGRGKCLAWADSQRCRAEQGGAPGRHGHTVGWCPLQSPPGQDCGHKWVSAAWDDGRGRAQRSYVPPPSMTHRQEVEAPVEAGLDPERSCHVDLGQCGHRDGVTSALSQVDSAQRHVDGQEVASCMLPWRRQAGSRQPQVWVWGAPRISASWWGGLA